MVDRVSQGSGTVDIVAWGSGMENILGRVVQAPGMEGAWWIESHRPLAGREHGRLVTRALGIKGTWQIEWHGLLAWWGHGGQGDTGPWHRLEHGQRCSCTKQN